MPRQAWKSWWGGGGGRDSVGSIVGSRHGVGVGLYIVHHQPLWQATKNKKKKIRIHSKERGGGELNPSTSPPPPPPPPAYAPDDRYRMKYKMISEKIAPRKFGCWNENVQIVSWELSRRALTLFNYVPLRTRRALSPYRHCTADSALLVLYTEHLWI